MKAICVTEGRTLDVREVPTPEKPARGHLLIQMDSATITHGDKFFLPHPLPAARCPADATLFMAPTAGAP